MSLQSNEFCKDIGMNGGDRMRETKTVTIISADPDDLPKSLEEFIGWLQDKLDEVPPEFRAAARCEYCCSREFGGELEITYQRPETDEEVSGRERYAQMVVADRVRRDVAELRRLIAKYPDEIRSSLFGAAGVDAP
jgi:hypothetical protein